MADYTPDWVNYRPLKWVAAPECVNASRLVPTDKAQLWRGIRQARPELASMLENDQAVKALMREFNASLLFEQPEFESLMEAGKQPKNG
ncbi:hypothetical protein [Methylophaga sp. OBS4]|uniref:hypothetical protein n=1 Tax=Methylophaga sp. OBS4 TaxID=2991935 RepID=UPI0022521F29|nr:hypothetical protein [Methylophaga sp. OBS4]MCX4187189.1 hypothetical protein [Methylophaga sp. OBS4]